MHDLNAAGLVNEARKNKFSTLQLSEEEIISVWDTVSEYVATQMVTQRGVTIPGLGTFTFTHKKMDIGNNKFILIQRPVFMLSEKFAQIHALNYTKHHTTGEIPVVQLNFTALSVTSSFDRDTVETCVREVLQSLSRAVANQQNVEFLFRGIGVLSIKNLKVKMKFFRDFLSSMDGSGNLVKVLENELFHGGCASLQEVVSKYGSSVVRRKRPGTADSVMSSLTTLSAQRRPGTTTFTLPKLGGTKETLLPPITENANEDGDGDRLSLASRGSRRETIQPHPVIGVSLDVDELKEALPAREGVRGSPVRKSPQPQSPRLSQADPEEADAGDVAEEPAFVAPPTPSPPSVPKQNPASLSVCQSRACHNKAGQELCYLCHQRASRNIPVSFEEERHRKELEQDALLQQYQQMKDQEAILMEQAQGNQIRQSNQKIAAFNLGVSEGVREEARKRQTEFVKSYVFQNRPLTPLRFYKQEKYSSALENQVKLRSERETRKKHDQEFQERLEQVQLAEDLAAQREQFLRTKADQIAQYQRALSAQIRLRKKLNSSSRSDSSLSTSSTRRRLSVPRPQLLNPFSAAADEKYPALNKPGQIRSKPLPLPKAEPDSKEPIFGKYDATNEKILEQKERARALLRSQLHMVGEKKKNSILDHLAKQKAESEMLKRTRADLIDDRVTAHKRAVEMRQNLERNWQCHHFDKMKRETNEKERLRTPGMLLLQQTEKYKRCGQCERRTHNCGESNIWSESRYIPGSRLMV